MIFALAGHGVRTEFLPAIRDMSTQAIRDGVFEATAVLPAVLGRSSRPTVSAAENSHADILRK